MRRLAIAAVLVAGCSAPPPPEVRTTAFSVGMFVRHRGSEMQGQIIGGPNEDLNFSVRFWNSDRKPGFPLYETYVMNEYELVRDKSKDGR